VLSEVAAAAALLGESLPSEDCSNTVTRYERQGIRRHESDSSARGWLGSPWRSFLQSRSTGSVGTEQERRELSVSIEKVCTFDSGDRMTFARVRGCDSRALLAAVERYHSGVTVLDALMGEKLSSSKLSSSQGRSSGNRRAVCLLAWLS
jgi:hypothetical protein